MARPNTPAEDLAEMLSTDGVGTLASTSSTGWGIFVSREPLELVRIITLYDRGGLEPSPRFQFDTEDVNVRIRPDQFEYQTGYDKAFEIRDSLLGRAPETRNGTRYTGIRGLGSINFVEYDESDRPQFTVNFRVWREPQSTASARTTNV